MTDIEKNDGANPGGNQGGNQGVVPSEDGPITAHSARPRRRRGRWVKRLVLLVVIPVLALVGASYLYAVTGRFVTTENAYVKAHIIAVSTDIDGRVTEVFVRNDQRVKAGELLFRLDPDTNWLELKSAEARMLTVRQEVEATRAEFHQVQAEIDEARETVSYFAREADRQRQLNKRGVTTEARLDEAEFEVASARQRVRALQEKVRTVLAELGGDPERAVELHPKYIEAQTAREVAELHLGYTEVRAPADGIVTQVHLEPGEWLEEGDPAFGLIEADDTWVVANLKETQLTHVREGQVVEVGIDAYPDVTWKARITSIAPATGAEFAVLPPQNASGNWVKVVQRIPVRIDLETVEGRPTLRAGMTASISIDTERERALLTTVRESLAALRGPDGEAAQ
ncbi:HlyD family secretion protein [Thalassobaculum litoreum]|uniref:Membrane fusion protein, multidrug efflux system n=1 Tax=Thalassobaculum litoreum DSM 18839 TaxID=1123362 RepID=A0A8G2F041_9PROT|nr:HlyD family secretion protein [Thalassobaculum litoreum]SDG32221.1 membrane fusion protein, multidrug efflux system [Thalassobaculum litoreum DSM 18839]